MANSLQPLHHHSASRNPRAIIRLTLSALTIFAIYPLGEQPAAAQRQITGKAFRLGEEVTQHRWVHADSISQTVKLMTAERITDREPRQVEEQYFQFAEAAE